MHLTVNVYPATAFMVLRMCLAYEKPCGLHGLGFARYAVLRVNKGLGI